MLAMCRGRRQRDEKHDKKDQEKVTVGGLKWHRSKHTRPPADLLEGVRTPHFDDTPPHFCLALPRKYTVLAYFSEKTQFFAPPVQALPQKNPF